MQTGTIVRLVSNKDQGTTTETILFGSLGKPPNHFGNRLLLVLGDLLRILGGTHFHDAAHVVKDMRQGVFCWQILDVVGSTISSMPRLIWNGSFSMKRHSPYTE
jgi:hypothetical protein